VTDVLSEAGSLRTSRNRQSLADAISAVYQGNAGWGSEEGNAQMQSVLADLLDQRQPDPFDDDPELTEFSA
jgi:hypothetical protein